MPIDKEKSAPLTIRKTTKERLDAIKHQGQSYDGIIQELLNLYGDELDKPDTPTS